MTSPTVQVSPAVLKWAAAQAGSSFEEIAGKVSVRDREKILAGGLTEAQAVKFSKMTATPLGFLFLPEPPVAREIPIADFRTTADRMPLGREFIEIFDDLKVKQTWYREFLQSTEERPLDFIGKFADQRASSEAIADDIRNTLNWSAKDRVGLRRSEDHYSKLVDRVESVGVLVFKNSVVGNNTHRKVSEKQFRGFAVADQFSPLVFINGADAPAAWVFTLIHELGHLWIGESGVSDVNFKSTNASERRCNSIAADFLVPKDQFSQAWKAVEGSDVDRVEALRRQFLVSALVVAIRANELSLAKADLVAMYLKPGHEKTREREGGGGDFYSTLAVRNSKRFSAKVASLAVAGEITFREAGRLLKVNPRVISEFSARRG